MINTVTGQVEKRDFGAVLVHEHIRCASNDLLHIFGKKWLDENRLADFAAEILLGVKEKYGLGLWVDGTPIDLGRDVALLKKVSEKSGVAIVASTGLYHFPSLYTQGHSEFEIASWFIDEFKNGMEGTDIKPGILKVASDRMELIDDNVKRLRALAIAQKETDLPLYVHSSHMGDVTECQLDILLNIIEKPEKILIGHTANRPHTEYLERILERGCCIVMDQCHCTRYSLEDIGKVLVRLCNDGYADRILLSNDLCIYTDFGSRKNTGFHLSVCEQVNRYGHLFDNVYTAFLEAGGSDQAYKKMLCENSVEALNI